VQIAQTARCFGGGPILLDLNGNHVLHLKNDVTRSRQQRLLFLKAIRSIEQDDRNSYWRFSSIFEQAYALSPELQDIEKLRKEAMAASDAHIRPRAVGGDPRAKLLMWLTRALVRSRRWDVGKHHRRGEADRCGPASGGSVGRLRSQGAAHRSRVLCWKLWLP
jgi:hypothetical protein